MEAAKIGFLALGDESLTIGTGIAFRLEDFPACLDKLKIDQTSKVKISAHKEGRS